MDMLEAFAHAARTPISVGDQAQLARAARRGARGDTIKVALLARGDLDAEVERELMVKPSARVMRAWLARPCRTQEEKENLLNQERRPSILAKLASDPDIELGSLRALRAKLTPVIATGLFKRSDLDDDWAFECAMALDTATAWGPIAEHVRANVEARPKVLAKLAEQTAGLFASVCLPHASGRLQQRLLQLAVVEVWQRERDTSWQWNSLRGEHETGAGLKLLRELSLSGKLSAANCRWLVGAVSLAGGSTSNLIILHELRDRVEQNEELPELVRRAALAGGGGLIEDGFLHDLAVSSHVVQAAQGEVVGALVGNTSVDASVLGDAVRVLQVTGHLDAWISRCEDAERWDLLAQACAGGLGTAPLVETLLRRRALRLAVINQDGDRQWWAHLSELDQLGMLDAETLKQLDAWHVERLGKLKNAAETLAHMLVAELGGTQAWDQLGVFWGREGTLGEWIEMARAL